MSSAVKHLGAAGSVVTTVVGMGLVKAFIMQAFLSVYRSFDPMYSNPHCLLRLVNETEPAHYAAHQYWRTLEYGDCDIETLVLNQFNWRAQMEFSLYKVVIASQAVGAMCLIAYAFKNKAGKVGVLSAILGNLFSCQNATGCMFGYMHFQNDLTYFIGNMQHHSDISKFTSMSNASAVDTLPNGFLACYVLNWIWFTICMRYLWNKFDLLKQWNNFYVCVACSHLNVLSVAGMLKTDHTLWHNTATESMKNSIPMSFNYRAYNHVFVHHVNGGALSMNYFFEPMYSNAFSALAYVHSHLLGIKAPDSAEHHAVIFAFDTLQSCVLMAVLVGLFSWGAIMVRALNTEKGAASKAVAAVWCIATFFYMLVAFGFLLGPNVAQEPAGSEL